MSQSCMWKLNIHRNQSYACTSKWKSLGEPSRVFFPLSYSSILTFGIWRDWAAYLKSLWNTSSLLEVHTGPCRRPRMLQIVISIQGRSVACARSEDRSLRSLVFILWHEIQKLKKQMPTCNIEGSALLHVSYNNWFWWHRYGKTTI